MGNVIVLPTPAHLQARERLVERSRVVSLTERFAEVQRPGTDSGAVVYDFSSCAQVRAIR